MDSNGQRGKRLLDLVVSSAALLFLAPVAALSGLLVAVEMGFPVLFCQQRPGLAGRAFTMLKFRTMTDDRDAAGNLKADADRLTRVGCWLRKTSLDELPQLWNVLRGEMSLVGPRPLLMEYLPHYTPEQARRHDVRPGITGWAQVNGRNVERFSERLRLDVWYVDHWSLGLDLRILARTFLQVIRSRDVQVDQVLAEVDDLGLHSETRKRLASRP